MIFLKNENFIATKRLHAHLLRTGSFFLPDALRRLILEYAASPKHQSLKTLTNCLKCVSPRNALLFNVIVSDLCRQGYAYLALKIVSFMHLDGFALDSYTLCNSLTASSSVGTVDFVKQMHAYGMKTSWLSSVFVGSALVDSYSKSSLIKDAAVVFDEIPMKNTVCGNALLSGYCEAKMWDKVLELVEKMRELNLAYDHFTLSAMLRAFAGLSAIELGRQVHGYVIRKVRNLGNDVFLQSSLIEMYGKCGLVVKAFQVFSLAGMSTISGREKDIVLWTSTLNAFGRNGYFEEVISLYENMLKEGIKPDEISLLSAISACGHTGQVKLGIQYLESMVLDHDLVPGPEHYSCLVDLLCRAGDLDKTLKLVNEMFRKGNGNGNVSMWGALLGACESHGHIQLGEFAAKKALELDPQNVGIYVMLSNLYASFGLWNEINKLREMMKQKGLKKGTGSSWVNVFS